MRIAVVSASPAFRCECSMCGKSCQVEPGRPAVYADLDGRPFVDYYCEECKIAAVDDPNAAERGGR